MAAEAKFVKIATVGAPYGVRGLLKLHVTLEDPSSLTTFTDLYIRYPRGRWEQVPPFSLQEKGVLTLIHFVGFDQRELAGAKFTHAVLGVQKEALPLLPEDQFYWEDLIGLMVQNQQGQRLGIVKQLFETGANDVLVIKTETGQEVLIPYVLGHFVIKVDLASRIMCVDWELS